MKPTVSYHKITSIILLILSLLLSITLGAGNLKAMQVGSILSSPLGQSPPAIST